MSWTSWTKPSLWGWHFASGIAMAKYFFTTTAGAVSGSLLRFRMILQRKFGKCSMLCTVMYVFFFEFAQIGRTRLHVSRFLCSKHPCLLRLCFCQQGVDWMMTEIGKQRHYENLVMDRFWQIHYPWSTIWYPFQSSTDINHRPWESQGIWWRYHRRSEIWKPAATRQRKILLEGTQWHVPCVPPDPTCKYPVNPLEVLRPEVLCRSCLKYFEIIAGIAAIANDRWDKHGMPRQRSALPEGA